MSGPILCRSEYSKRPFYVSGLGANVYSIEEICYYLYNNVYLLNMGFFSEELFDFIAGDLKETELSKRLASLKDGNAGLAEMVLTILRYVDYYSDSEIEKLSTIIENLDTQNINERLKAMADNYLTSKRYYNAIKYYEEILAADKEKKPPVELLVRVWHNMGVAYSRMFDFPDAAMAFLEAVRLGGGVETKKALFNAISMIKSSDAVKAVNYIEVSGIDENEQEELKFETAHELETLLDSVDKLSGYDSVKQALSYKEEGRVSEFNKKIDEIIEGWKKDYYFFIK